MFTSASKFAGRAKSFVTSTTRVLMHFDGTDGGTDITDVFSRPVTRVGSVTLEAEHAKFGATSGFFPGGTDYLSLPNTDSTFTLGTSDFTIDSWLYRTSASYNGGLEVPWSTFQWQGGFQGGFSLQLDASNISFTAFSGSALMSAGMTLPLNAWVHVAVTREGNTFRLFVDGVKRAEVVNSGSITMPTAHAPVLRIGATIGDGGAIVTRYMGYQDEFNFIKGQALYTADFTPPSAPYTP